MKVLVTGAAGRLGSVTCQVLIKAGVDVRATDRRVVPDLSFHVRVADLTNREICYELVDGIDALVHLGNHPTQHAGDAQTVFNDNCVMNMNIFQAAQERGVRKIVFASSIQAITGERRALDGRDAPPSSLPYLPLDGDVPPNPSNYYGVSKEASEALLKYFSRYHQISAVAIRFPLLPSTEMFAKNRHPIESTRDGAHLDECFSMLSIPDAARLILAILNSSLPGYRVYLPAARSTWLTMPIAEIVKQFYPNVPLRKPISELHSLIDISRITEETGWSPNDEHRT